MTNIDLTKLLSQRWVTTVILMFGLPKLLQAESSITELGPFNPNNSHDAQPKTFRPPVPETNCSVYQPGTCWHFIKTPHTGRCCRQIFVINGMFHVCDVNGGQDQLVMCPEGFYNRKVPYLSGRFQFPGVAEELCQDESPLDGIGSPNITWDYENFIRPKGRSVILRGRVFSATDLEVAYLFKDDDSLPIGEMKYTKVDRKTWLVEYTIPKLTSENGGLYSILAVNKQNNARSGKAYLRVLDNAGEKPSTSSVSPSSNPTLTEKSNAGEKPSTSSVSPSSNPTLTEKSNGINTDVIITSSVVVVFVIFSVVCFLIWKSKVVQARRKDARKDEQDDQKKQVTESFINPRRTGIRETEV